MYLYTGDKKECCGCEACVQICARKAIYMREDEEGFRYPYIDETKCINCDLCKKVCPSMHMPEKHHEEKYVYGGYIKDKKVRFESTSGGAFSAIVDAFCDANYVIFGAQSRGLLVFHKYITDKQELWKFRKSKYNQSIVGNSYIKCREFLMDGKKVLFSGTPCQIAALIAYLNVTNTVQENLLTVEVICEGVPSPLYMRKLEDMFKDKYGSSIKSIDYRYKGKSIFSNGKWDFEKMLLKSGGGRWDFQQMRIEMMRKNKIIVIDRWFNPFWSIWLQHLMSRPSCYNCSYTTEDRVADITLGDLWGVHIYCPELYGKNGGSSLVVCNSEKGRAVFRLAQEKMYGHELSFEDAIKYQSPMRKTIDNNPQRGEFMNDLRSKMNYDELNRKWAKPPTIRLLFQKYVYGNRQKVMIWSTRQWVKRMFIKD